MPHIDTLDWSLHTHIALDLDETLACSVQDGLDSLHALGKMKNIPTSEFVTNFLCEDLYGSDMTNAELAKFWHTHRIIHANPLDNAINGVQALYSLEKEISIITARHDALHRKDTEIWLMKHIPTLPIENLHFVNHTAGENHPKSIVCREKNITLLIDDGYHNITDALQANITCILLDKPWNRHETLEHPLLYRASDWKSIIQSLEKHVI